MEEDDEVEEVEQLADMVVVEVAVAAEASLILALGAGDPSLPSF